MPKESRKLSFIRATPYSRGGSTVSGKKLPCPVCANCSLEWVELSRNAGESKKRAENQDVLSECDDNFDQFDDQHVEDSDDFFDEVGDFGDEDAYEGVGTGLKPGETFEDHIHFGDPEDEVWDEGYSISNGIFHYWRTTSSGRTYEYRGLVGETDITRLRAM